MSQEQTKQTKKPQTQVQGEKLTIKILGKYSSLGDYVTESPNPLWNKWKLDG